MKGVEFVVNEEGTKKAVIIDIKKHGDLWEDFYDTLIARERKAEPRESLEDVKKKILGRR
ncbi:MAG: hypothetical protein Q7U02_11215 [Desulfosalsimonadaceae bacterium]|nr:hypothetical protein [Desulfosalsimonadaceae bacterium]